MVAVVLGACGWIAVTAPGLGDYPTDAGPALTAIAHGQLGGFFAHQPAMGAFSLLVRVPFVAIGAAFHGSTLDLYRWGVVPCILALGLLAIAMSRIAARRGASRLGQVLIVAICLFNPLVGDALYWGHPEEILTASLAVGALLAAGENRVVLTAVLTGLAIASKQWALLVLIPAVLILARDRVRAVAISLGAAAVVTLPMLVGNFAAFRHMLAYISRPQPVVTPFTWLFALSPGGTVHVTNIFGGQRSFVGHRLLSVEAALSHPLIIVIGLTIPLALWWRASQSLTMRQLLSASAVVLLIRCALDPGSVDYYHLALLLCLVAIDVTDGRPVPALGLGASAATYLVFGLGVNHLGDGALNAVYVATSVVAIVVLGSQLTGSGPAKMLRGRTAPALAGL